MVDPKQILVVFKSEKTKQNKTHFPTSTFIFKFPPSLFQFSFFSSPFSPFFRFLASFFPIDQQKFPGQKSRGWALCPLPPPRLLRHWLRHVIFKYETHLKTLQIIFYPKFRCCVGNPKMRTFSLMW